MQEESVYLFQREGSTDKVYNLHLRDNGNGLWRTDYENARRGGSLKPKVKIEPLPYAEAKVAYDKIVASKLKGGYTPDPSGVRFLGTELAGRRSGESPQLPVEMTAEELEGALRSDLFCLQEKKDGENRTLERKPGEAIQGINKKSLYTAVAETWATDFRALGDSFVIPGEAIGDQFHAFDLLELDGEDLRPRPFKERYARLVAVSDLRGGGLRGFNLVPAYFSEAEKRAKWAEFEALNREGAVFKQVSAPHAPGKNKASLKKKFAEESTFEVLAKNVQRSVQIGAYDDKGNVVQLGSVTIPPSESVPEVGSFIDVKYLYRFEDGSLEQPRFSKHRPDQAAEDALLSQITRVKLKSELVSEEEPETTVERPRG